VKDDRLYLVHIRECIERIEAYVADGREVFLADAKTQDAVLRNLQTLCESTQRLSLDLKLAHPSIDWQGIAGFRNVLVHQYLGISLERAWEIVLRDLPPLKRDVLAMLEELGE
jgi:uncharacterized protein with HEPN domain